MPLIVCGVMVDSTEPSQPLVSHMFLRVCTLSLPLFAQGERGGEREREVCRNIEVTCGMVCTCFHPFFCVSIVFADVDLSKRLCDSLTSGDIM